MRAASLIGLAAFAAPLVSLHAQGKPASSPVEFARQAETLKPGEWVWAPEIAPSGPVLVTVDLGRQLATVYRNGVRIAVTTVSSGKRGHETPTGVFTILQKDAKHRSSTYNNAPMPYQQRLTWDGVALHAGGLPGYPESHGCVHLPMEFARQLFQTTDMGGTVIVSGTTGRVETAEEAGVLASADFHGQPSEHRALAPDEGWRWEPEKSPSGPLSIIVSRSDRRMIVLRDGVEIGRAKVGIVTTDTGTHVYTYAGLVGGERRWMVAGVPGHAGEQGRAVRPWALEGIDVPPNFLTAVRADLAPGATILVTQARVLPANSGRSLTVLASR
jgi:hypothetical protein